MKFDIIEVRKLINGVQKEKTYNKLEEIASDCICPNNIAVDIKKLLWQMGFTPAEIELEEGTYAIIKQGKDDEMGIDKYTAVNESEKVEWQRLYYAIALAHYILDFKKEPFEYVCDYSSDMEKKERLHLNVALVILMPEQRFKRDGSKVFKEVGGDMDKLIKRMAIDYGVPLKYAQARVRATKIGKGV